MFVSSSEVQASAQRSYTKVQSSVSTTRLMKESDLNKIAGKEIGNGATMLQLSSETAKQLSQQAAAANSNNKHQMSGFKLYKPSSVRFGVSKAANPQEVKLRLLEAMIYALTGKRISANIWQPKSGNESSGENGDSSQVQDFSLSQFLGQAGERPEAMRQVTQTEHFFYESESLSYQAKGLINTADGKTISVDVNMYLSREFVSYTSTSMVWEKPKDPLVINYAGTAASLTEQTYSFDLSMDGKQDQIHFAGQGSGFLAVDWNGDKTINDGGELFGAKTGDGFGELRAYDADGNGWIDEADDIFDKLLVWSKDENGNDQIFTLRELDIGAIYLGAVDTQFSFTDDQNSTQGIMRSTSFFLKENGGAGTVSHVDLMI